MQRTEKVNRCSNRRHDKGKKLYLTLGLEGNEIWMNEEMLERQECFLGGGGQPEPGCEGKSECIC